MNPKNENPDDLVVSATGEMMSSQRSEDLKVKQAPDQPPAQKKDSQSASGEVQSNDSARTAGLTPPELPNKKPQEAIPPQQKTTIDGVKQSPNTQKTIHPAPKQGTGAKPSGHSFKEKAKRSDVAQSSDMLDKNFAKQHSNQKRTAVPVHPHHARNNKKFLATLIIFSALLLSGLAVYVYLSAEENVVEAPTTPEVITPNTENDNMINQAEEPSPQAPEAVPLNDQESEPSSGDITPTTPDNQDNIELEQVGTGLDNQ